MTRDPYQIGAQYAQTRREDPDLARSISSALGGSRTVVNIGAGAGSYEPTDRYVLALEPSDVMAAQRPSDLAPALGLGAGPLPLRDDSVDAAMAVLTIHHWGDQLETGVREMRRVARGPVVIVTYDPAVSTQMWLVRDYMPEAADLDRRLFPPIDALAEWLGGATAVEAVLTPRTTPDWTIASFWAHPERVLDEDARRGTSAFALMAPSVIERVESAVAADLADGSWDRRYGHLRSLPAFDAGMRLVVAEPTRSAPGRSHVSVASAPAPGHRPPAPA
jgi:SAM-dependent methyltransferase